MEIVNVLRDGCAECFMPLFTLQGSDANGIIILIL